MDSGTGAFVLGHGIVAGITAGSTQRTRGSLFREYRPAIMMVGLGVFRFALLASVDYDVPIVEYGVHWNFFITLGILSLVATLLHRLISSKAASASYLLLALGISVAYEIVLQHYEFSDVVLDTYHGDTFIEQNKEGIFGLPGYISLYYWGYIISRNLPSNERRHAFYFSCISCLSFVLIFASSSYFPDGIETRPSRRLVWK